MSPCQRDVAQVVYHALLASREWLLPWSMPVWHCQVQLDLCCRKLVISSGPRWSALRHVAFFLASPPRHVLKVLFRWFHDHWPTMSVSSRALAVLLVLGCASLPTRCDPLEDSVTQ